MSSLPSPCVGICKFDKQTELCLGCNRDKQEISEWKILADNQQYALFSKLPNRRASCGFGFAVIPWKNEQTTNFAVKCLNDQRCSWSVGAYGASANFCFDSHEKRSLSQSESSATMTTDLGAIHIDFSKPFKPLALYDCHGSISQILFGAYRTKYDAPSPSCITSIGRDNDALRPADRERELFDLALGYPHTAFHVRSFDECSIKTLETFKGSSFKGNKDLATKLKALSPHRVITSPLARIEVYQPIPSQGQTTQTGPHSHLMPELLETGLLHGYGDRFPPDYRIGLTLHLGQSNLAQDIPL